MASLRTKECKCLKCGLTFIHTNGSGRRVSKQFCSKACRSKKVARTCIHCGDVRMFKPSSASIRLHKSCRPCSLKRKSGAGNANWRGGKANENTIIRRSAEYKAWRKAVFERDGYRCVACGAQGTLNADHIKPFAKFPELRLDVNNGRTLCVPCHMNTESYLAKSLNIRPETEIQKEIVTALTKLGEWVIRTGVSVKRGNRGTNSGEKGMPDILLPAVAGGSWLEVKNINGKLSEGQKEWHARAAENAINVAVVRDAPDAIETVSKWKKEYAERVLPKKAA